MTKPDPPMSDTSKQTLAEILEKFSQDIDSGFYETSKQEAQAAIEAVIQGERLNVEAETLQWVEDLGTEATKNCSVHNMDEYHRKYGAGVSSKVHNRLLDEALPRLKAFLTPEGGQDA